MIMHHDAKKTYDLVTHANTIGYLSQRWYPENERKHSKQKNNYYRFSCVLISLSKPKFKPSMTDSKTIMIPVVLKKT